MILEMRPTIFILALGKSVEMHGPEKFRGWRGKKGVRRSEEERFGGCKIMPCNGVLHGRFLGEYLMLSELTCMRG